MSKADLDEEDDLLISGTKNRELTKSKHQQIVDGSSKLFFEKGFHPTTIREIARVSGMSMGQLYHYISSKDDVLFLMHRHMQRMWYNRLIESGVESAISPEGRLRKALEVTLDLILKEKKLFQFVYTESKYLEKKHLRSVLSMDDENVVGFWRRLLNEVNEKKKLADDVDFLANIIAYLLVFIPLRGWNLKKKPMKKNVESLIAFILRGLDMD